jgi:hypothetical protein
MQASYYIAILSTQEIERNVQERIRYAEREHLLRILRENRISRYGQLRVAIGELVVRFGRKIEGNQVPTERWIDVPGAVGQSR